MKALGIITILVAGFAVASPASAETTYRYCMIGTPNMGMDCTFSTLQQCQVAASSGVGFCQENSAYIASRQAVPHPARR